MLTGGREPGAGAPRKKEKSFTSQKFTGDIVVVSWSRPLAYNDKEEWANFGANARRRLDVSSNVFFFFFFENVHFFT